MYVQSVHGLASWVCPSAGRAERDRAGKDGAADGYAYIVDHYSDTDIVEAAKKRLAAIRGANA